MIDLDQHSKEHGKIIEMLRDLSIKIDTICAQPVQCEKTFDKRYVRLHHILVVGGVLLGILIGSGWILIEEIKAFITGRL